MSLQQLPSLTKALYPGMYGQIGYTGQQGIISDGDNRHYFTDLYQHWHNAHPEAGVAYASLKSWRLLCWQPALVAVLSVHILGIAPDIGAIKQIANKGIVFGYELPDRGVACSLSLLIIHAGKELKQLCEGLFEGLVTVAPVKKKLAFRLLADALMDALIKVYRMNRHYKSKDIQCWADCWLSAMNQKNDSDLMILPLDDLSEGLGIKRKACCLHYLQCSGDLCASCPKQSLAIRKVRLQEEWNANV
ncbi:MAG: siderophore ferric iron reductase [Endozoicomonas sp. (ex Botrylloides leachii)]|nr:siderophore ferric iron reductase [Endozoicomonas sp. (ex Botrylloides leachii)]